MEFSLENGKSIDVYLNHNQFGELLCEFRSIHINPANTTTHEEKTRVKKIIRKKISDKTKDLDFHSLPAPLSFLFVIQIHDSAELSQEMLNELNSIQLDKNVLPLMICRLGLTANGNNEHFEIIQIKNLINDN